MNSTSVTSPNPIENLKPICTNFLESLIDNKLLIDTQTTWNLVIWPADATF